VGDEVTAVDGRAPRDILEWRSLVDEADPVLDVVRGGLQVQVTLDKRAGEPLGAEVSSALFDQVRTCDNHCEFCFIYQLPPGLRKSLYLKDDDYRLSFLYGNFTTLTRFTEADLERVVTEGLGPLNVSIHATDPDVRTEMLRNRRGATSLRWLRALLDHGIEVHGQVVVCPDVNDGPILDDTLAGVLDRFPELASVAVVPLGVSRFNREARMRAHTPAEAGAVIDVVEAWQATFLAVLGRRLAFAADEWYVVAGRDLPPAESYEGFPMHEDGIGMVRTLELELLGAKPDATGRQAGFFVSADAGAGVGGPSATTAASCGAPVPGPDVGFEPYRGARATPDQLLQLRPRRDAPVAVLTGSYGARLLPGLLAGIGRDDVRVVEVENRFFGGNTAVAGLLVGEDLARVLADEPTSHRYLLPDACLSNGRFLDGTEPADLPRPVEVVPTDGHALRRALVGGSR
jgi:NifB/MoaA-like Fe-S oxidoreductase